MFARLLIATITAGAIGGWLMAGGPAPTDMPEPRPATAARETKMAPTIARPSSPPPSATSGYGGREIVIERKPDGHYYADATINGQLVRFLIDTGATTVALTEKDARHVGLAFSTSEFSVIGRGASGDVRGKNVTIDRISLGHLEATRVRGAIIGNGLDVSLLGQSFLSRIGSVRIADDRMTLR